MAGKVSGFPMASARVRALSVCAKGVMLGVLVGACGAEEEGADIESAASALMQNAPLAVSQVYGAGGGTGATLRNDFVELFNRSTSPVALDGLSLQYGSATGVGAIGSSGQIALFPAGASIAPGRYYLIQLSGGSTGAALPTPDATPSPSINLAAGSGKVALVSGTTSLGCNGANLPCDAAAIARIIDLVGYGTANFSEASATPALSSTSAALRKTQGCTDTNSNLLDFDLAPPSPRNASTQVTSCTNFDAAPRITSTVPSAGSIVVAESLSSIQLTFSEAVTPSGAWASLACSVSGTVPLTVSGALSAYTLTLPTTLEDGESCQLVVSAALVSDDDAVDPPDVMLSDFSLAFSTLGTDAIAVHAVQGAGHRSALEGQTRSVGPAIVTAVQSNGFFMESAVPDSDPATSEGIFVFTSSAPSVLVGDRVVVQGKVEEFRPGCAACAPSNSAYANLTTTELTAPQVTLIARSQALPSPVALGSGGAERSLPTQVFEDDAQGDIELAGSFDPNEDGLDFLESLEGMRVSLAQPVVVDPTRSFSGGSLEIGVLTRSGAFASPRTARGGIEITPNDFNPERLFLSNALVPTFPTLNVGDRFEGQVVGIVDYSFANYKILVSEALPTTSSGGITREVTPLSAVLSTQLTVANLNVENLDAADAASKFERLASIVVDHLRSPDLIALEEVQDNDGATNNSVTDASQTLNRFITAIQTAGGPIYTYRQIDPVDDQDGGEPGGNIRVVFLYRTDRGLQFVDRPGATPTTANSVSNAAGTPQLTYSPGRISPANAAFNSSRKPLAAELTFRGTTFFVVANHFNSKGGDQPLSGRFQPPQLSSEAQRIQQADLVAGFVQALFLVEPTAAVIVLGDLNDFSFSPPLSRLKATGLVDLIEGLPQGERYTYVYQGNSQDLDHILLSPSLAQRSTFDVVHVNAEFADQASDHDPSVVKIELGTAAQIGVVTPPATLAAGSQFSLQLQGTGSPAPQFVLEQGPPGMQVNAATGLLTWQAQGPGTYPVRVRAENGVGAPAVVSFDLTVISTGTAVPALAPWSFAMLALGLLAIARGMRTTRGRRA